MLANDVFYTPTSKSSSTMILLADSVETSFGTAKSELLRVKLNKKIKSAEIMVVDFWLKKKHCIFPATNIINFFLSKNQILIKHNIYEIK